jgi:hypothetical protein
MSSLEQARQSIAFLNQFMEQLRQQQNVNVLNLFTYADIANLHVAMARLNSFIVEQPQSQPQQQQSGPKITTI